MSTMRKLIKDHWIKPVAVIGMFLICLSTSILIKKWFGLDGDYLSAFATLVAACIALHLYTDWRDQERYNLAKEHVLKIFGITARMRFRFNKTQEMAIDLKKSDMFVVLNKDFLEEDESLREVIFGITPNVRFLDSNEILDLFYDLERHYRYLENFKRWCQQEYQKYYFELTNNQGIDFKSVSVIQYHTYQHYEIVDKNYAEDLIKILNRPVGYKVVDSDDVEFFQYQDIETMAKSSIALVDEFDNLIKNHLESLIN